MITLKELVDSQVLTQKTDLNSFKIRNLEKYLDDDECLDDDPELDNAKLFTYLLRLEDKIIKLENEVLEIMQKLKNEERK